MILRFSAVVLLLTSFFIPVSAQTAPKTKAAESFRTLTAQQKELAYWLTQAAIAIDPIIYGQLSPYGIRQKRVLEEVVSHAQGIDPKVMANITTFAKLFWANRGNHNEMTAQKFVPDFTF